MMCRQPSTDSERHTTSVDLLEYWSRSYGLVELAGRQLMELNIEFPGRLTVPAG